MSRDRDNAAGKGYTPTQGKQDVNKQPGQQQKTNLGNKPQTNNPTQQPKTEKTDWNRGGQNQFDKDTDKNRNK